MKMLNEANYPPPPPSVIQKQIQENLCKMWLPLSSEGDPHHKIGLPKLRATATGSVTQ